MLNNVLLEWLPWIFNRSLAIFDTSKRIALAVYTEATVKKEWIFLKSLEIPVSSMIFPNIPDTIVKWRVELCPTIFYGNPSMPSKHISYLGLTVYLPDGNVCELTDWVNDVKWSGMEQPNEIELFTLWCCEMGMPYFHMIHNSRFEVITECGDLINYEFKNTKNVI